MISYIHGTLIQKRPTHIVVDAGGLGYLIHIPLSSFEKMGEMGRPVKVLTYLHMREDGLQLFGFMSEEERDLFELLIAVSGVGPKLAQAILSGISVQDFKRAVLYSDLGGLTSIPGVGKKTAQRLILELKERFEAAGAPEEILVSVGPAELGGTGEAVLALVSLGLTQTIASRMVARVIKKDGDGLPVEEIIRRALRQSA